MVSSLNQLYMKLGLSANQNLLAYKLHSYASSDIWYVSLEIQYFSKKAATEKGEDMFFTISYIILINFYLVFAASTSKWNNYDSDSPDTFEFKTIQDILLYLKKKPYSLYGDLTTTSFKPNEKINQEHSTFQDVISGHPKQLLMCHG